MTIHFFKKILHFFFRIRLCEITIIIYSNYSITFYINFHINLYLLNNDSGKYGGKLNKSKKTNQLCYHYDNVLEIYKQYLKWYLHEKHIEKNINGRIKWQQFLQQGV